MVGGTLLPNLNRTLNSSPLFLNHHEQYSTLTTIVLQMRLMSGIIGTATSANLFVGQIGMEVEFLDAQNNERLAAAVTKQAGKKYIPMTGRKFDPTSTWGQVEQEMDYLAQKLRVRLDVLHGKTASAGESQ